MEAVRINKYLSEAGVCSRREADRLVESGQVLVDGVPAVTGMAVTDANVIEVRGNRICRGEEAVILAVNKPAGIVCTTAGDEPDNIVDYIHYPSRIYPVGRLDKMSEGLILMTNQGEIMDQILRGRNYHEKEYVVTVNRPVTLDFLEQMRRGVPILDTVTRPCRVEKLEYNRFRITLTQGLNRQIRRMCEALGYRVTKLVRVRVMNIRLGDLPSGAWRKVEGRELEELMRMLAEKPVRKPEAGGRADRDGSGREGKNAGRKARAEK